jgi:hypothetical protein
MVVRVNSMVIFKVTMFSCLTITGTAAATAVVCRGLAHPGQDGGHDSHEAFVFLHC